MLGSYDLVAFVLTNDAARAKTFYSDTLGLKFISQDDYAVVFDANGTMVRVTTIAGHTPTEHTVVGWNVPDIRAVAAALTQAGIRFEKYSFVEQDELGIWSSPDGRTQIAWFKDPDGNVLSIAQQ
jgi:catechol 2,3-dioxygenase-like lactoylglutathione lyase family enzyme